MICTLTLWGEFQIGEQAMDDDELLQASNNTLRGIVLEDDELPTQWTSSRSIYGIWQVILAALAGGCPGM